MSEAPFREPLGGGISLQKGLYQVRELVGSGNFSLTYAAFQRPGKLPVAIKEFFPLGCWRSEKGIEVGPPWTASDFAQSIEAFFEEGKILERFDHPGIVKVLGAFRGSATAYLVEELLQGSTLGALLERGEIFDEPRLLDLIRQVGEALVEIHAAGFVHSDIKPDNLFLTDSGRYVILDFGTARSHSPDQRDRPGVAAVSPGYSPLEQYQKGHRLTPAADVYALAATCYHCLTGIAPPDARKRNQGSNSLPVSGISGELERALVEALQLHPLVRTPALGPLLHRLGLEDRVEVRPEPFHLERERLAHLGAVQALALDRLTQSLYSGGRDGRICAWHWPELNPRFSLPGHPRSPISALDVSRDGNFLLSGAQDGTIKLWSTQGIADPHWLVAPGPPVLCLRFHPQQDLMVAGFSDGHCRLMGPGVSEPPWAVHQGAVLALDLHPQGHLLATGGSDRCIHLWDLATRQLRHALLLEGPVHCLRFNADGSGLLAGWGDQGLGLWDLETHRLVRDFHGHRAEVWRADFVGDSRLLITLSADQTLYGIKADSGRVVLSTQVSQGLSAALVIDPPGRLLASGGSDGRLCCWRY